MNENKQKKMSKNEDVNCCIDWLENSIDSGRFTYYDYKEFKNEQSIGKGSFGSVVRVTWKNTDAVFALKSFNLDRITLKEVVNEVMYLGLLCIKI